MDIILLRHFTCLLILLVGPRRTGRSSGNTLGCGATTAGSHVIGGHHVIMVDKQGWDSSEANYTLIRAINHWMMDMTDYTLVPDRSRLGGARDREERKCVCVCVCDIGCLCSEKHKKGGTGETVDLSVGVMKSAADCVVSPSQKT
uniref:Secreted protein n=1 Tax=Monopterus albus TaxID=43700 RepID=A0A3Q3KFF1_MONAL